MHRLVYQFTKLLKYSFRSSLRGKGEKKDPVSINSKCIDKIKQASFFVWFLHFDKYMLKDLGTEGQHGGVIQQLSFLKDMKGGKRGRTIKQRLGKGGKMQTDV